MGMKKVGLVGRIHCSNMVPGDFLIVRYDNQPFGLRLCYQHSVKRVFVVLRQQTSLFAMKERYR